MIKGLILQSWVFAVSIGFCGNDRCWAPFRVRDDICIPQLCDCTRLVKTLVLALQTAQGRSLYSNPRVSNSLFQSLRSWNRLKIHQLFQGLCDLWISIFF